MGPNSRNKMRKISNFAFGPIYFNALGFNLIDRGFSEKNENDIIRPLSNTYNLENSSRTLIMKPNKITIHVYTQLQ